MSRPTSYPDFALTGDKTAPSSGLKNTGWLPGLKLPAQILNYLLNLNGLWHRSHVVDLDALDSAKANREGGNSWTGNQQWQAGSALTEYLNTLIANAANPLQRIMKLQTSSNADEVSVWTGPGLSSQATFLITYNAAWGGSQWSQLVGSRPSACLSYRRDLGIWEFGRKDPGSAAWSSWTGDGVVALGTLGASSVLTSVLTSDASQTSFSPALTTTETLPLMSMVGLNGEPDSLYIGSVAPSSVSSVWFTFQVPHNVTPGNLRFFHHRQADSYNTVFRLHQRSLAFADGGATPSLTLVSGASYTESIGAGTGSFEGGFNLSSAGLDPELEYLIEWQPGNTGDRLYGIRLVGSSTTGPRGGVR